MPGEASPGRLTFPQNDTTGSGSRRVIGGEAQPPPPSQLFKTNEDEDPLGRAMDQVVRLLLLSTRESSTREPTNSPLTSDEYIQKHPGRDFRFYVYDTLPSELDYQSISKCIEKKWNPSGDMCELGVFSLYHAKL